MASKARLVTASERVTGLVDRGYEIDVDLKNLTFEDKGIKKILAEELEETFGEDTAVRVEGKSGAATVTQSEKYAVKGNAETIDKVRKAAEQGLLGDAVKVEPVVNIPLSDRERAVEVLKAAGIAATSTVTVAIVPKEYRTLKDSETSSAEAAEAKAALNEVAERSVSYRVKYEKK